MSSEEVQLLTEIRDLLVQLHKDNLDKLQLAKERLGTPQQQIESEQEPQKVLTIQTVRKMLPDDYDRLFTYHQTEDHVVLRFKEYLGDKRLFAQIAGLIRDQLGGEYISAGRDSHFRVPRR